MKKDQIVRSRSPIKNSDIDFLEENMNTKKF